MTEPSFAVLQYLGEDRWKFLARIPRRAGLPARKARAQAIRDATHGLGDEDATYAAVLWSEWSIAIDWKPL